MRIAPIKLYRVEGAVRPSAVRWLTNTAIVVCRTSGTLEIQPDYNQSTSSVYRIGLGMARLQPIPKSAALLVLGDEIFEVIRDGGRGLMMNSGVLPPGLGSVGACVITGLNLYVLASREGALWNSSDGNSWSFEGRLTIHEVTAGCAFANGQYAFGSAHGEVELVALHPFSAKVRQRLHADAVQDLFALDKDTLCTVSRDRALRVWRISPTFELMWEIPDLHGHFINCGVRVGDEIWTASSDGTIAITSITTRARTEKIKAHSDSVRILDLSQDGARLLSLSDDATYNVYDARSRALLKRHGEERQYIRAGDFLFRDGRARAALGSTSGVLQQGEIETGTFSKTRISAFSLRALRYLNETQILCGDETGVLRLFDTVREQFSVSVPVSAGLTAIRINPRDQSVLCGYRDGSISVSLSSSLTALSGGKSQSRGSKSDSQHEQAFESLSIEMPLSARISRRVHESIVGDLLPLPNGLMISCSDDHTIKTILIDSLSILKTTSLDGTAINNLLLISNLLVATTDGGVVFVLDVNTHEICRRYASHASPVRAISGISDSVIATGDRLGEVRIWDLNTCDTLSVNRFRERVIELRYELGTQRLYVITEAELASLQLDSSWFSAVDRPKLALERNELVDIADDQTLKTTVDRPETRDFDEVTVKPLPIAIVTSARDDVEIAKTGKFFQLSLAEGKLLRKFARWRGGTRSVVGILSGGLSDARVFRVQVFDQSGATRINAVAKIGSHAAIGTEINRYDTEVSRLSPTATPRRLDSPDFADEGIAGVFYSLADKYNRSAFQVAVRALATAPRVVEQVADLTAPWRDRVPETPATIGDVRRRVLKDSKLRDLAVKYRLDWIPEFEQRTVQVRWCTIHGDLHGGNILVERRGIPIIIDYGEVGHGSAPFDPITLEFSHLFHPDGPLRGSEWPKSAQARTWKTEEYLRGSPMPEISRACWQWAESVCAGHREIAAAAYAYLILQLKYPDTDKDRALDLLLGVRSFYEST